MQQWDNPRIGFMPSLYQGMLEHGTITVARLRAICYRGLTRRERHAVRLYAQYCLIAQETGSKPTREQRQRGHNVYCRFVDLCEITIRRYNARGTKNGTV